jgi:hypothetical protein
MSDTLLCTDCKHSFRAWYDVVFLSPKRHSLRCRQSYKPDETEIDLVTGPKRTAAHYETCGMARLNSGTCGKNGKLWQPKNKKDLFKLIKKETY